MRKRWIWITPLALLGMALFAFLGGEVVHALWNWLLPPLFGWPRVGFWQALGLLALCRILFGGFGLTGSARSGLRGRMAERFDRMSPEEREQYRQRIRVRWGFGPAKDESRAP